MTSRRVWILYEPKLYADLFRKVFEGFGSVEIIRADTGGDGETEQEIDCPEQIDIILLPLDESGQPKLSLLPGSLPEAKLLAFSPGGGKGMKRMPGETAWEELHPFGLADLMYEILSKT